MKSRLCQSERSWRRKAEIRQCHHLRNKTDRRCVKIFPFPEVFDWAKPVDGCRVTSLSLFYGLHFLSLRPPSPPINHPATTLPRTAPRGSVSQSSHRQHSQGFRRSMSQVVSVVPAQAGTQSHRSLARPWVPACARMTDNWFDSDRIIFVQALCQSERS
jgi:hypothetical protein